MNNNPEPAVALETGGEKAAEQSEDAQSIGAGPSGTPPTLYKRFLALFGVRNGSTIRDDLEDALAEHGLGENSFSPGERAMLNNILRLREVRVEDVMVPRAEIEAIDIHTSLSELLILFEKSGHSRMPVYDESLDDPRGMIHIRDVVAHMTRGAGKKRSRNGAKTPAPPTPAVALRPVQGRSGPQHQGCEPRPTRAVRAALPCSRPT